jgi:hypothetical protein
MFPNAYVSLLIRKLKGALWISFQSVCVSVSVHPYVYPPPPDFLRRMKFVRSPWSVLPPPLQIFLVFFLLRAVLKESRQLVLPRTSCYNFYHLKAITVCTTAYVKEMMK